jgi:ABC-2 type transport system ATP-binding protein
MIVLENASRWYGQVIGLNDVSCTIGPGVTALLGMNGAGKTTLIRLVTGQMRPTTGTVTVFGEAPFGNFEVFHRLGYCPEIDNFYEHMSGREFVYVLARMAGFGHAEARRRTDLMIDQVGMSDRADRQIAGFSKGMRQRIKLAQAMLHDPDIILLDEPLNGLDPVGRRELMDLLGDLADRGKSIVVSSHILFEVEQMTRNILLLHRGRLLATGDLRVIRSLIDTHPHRIRVDSPDPRPVAESLIGLPYVMSVEVMPGGRGIELETKEPDRFYSEFPKLVLERNLQLEGFTSPDNNLEAVFRYLVGE